MTLQARSLKRVAIPSYMGLSQPRSPALQMDFLPSEPPGEPKNIGVGCHFLLQGIFPTRGLNPGLLHCREILYHLTHQGTE